MSHAEAFKLMQYDSDDGTETEVLWNSRNGVTPFVLTLRSGKQGTHARWSDDVLCNETMARALGVRWFSDHTEETARPAAIAYVEKFWDREDLPMQEMWADKGTAVEYFVQEWLGSPTVIDCPGPPDREVKVPKFSNGPAGPGRFA